MTSAPRSVLPWLEAEVYFERTGHREALSDLDGHVVERLLEIQQRLWSLPGGEPMKPTNRQHHHTAADRIWDCAYSFAHCRHWDARGFEPRPDWLVTDIKVIFTESMREVLPGGGLPIQAAGFYARAFYTSASQTLSLLQRHPAAFSDVARFTKSQRNEHPITRVRNEIVEHPKVIDGAGHPIDSFGTSHSLQAGVALARNDGPSDAGLVANAAALLKTLEAVPPTLG